MTGYGVRGLASPHQFWVPPGARCASFSALDVPVIMQLKFLQFCENVEVPQFPFFDRVLQLPVVLQRRLRAEKTVH